MDDDLFLSERIDDFHTLCISTLARKTLVDNQVENLGGHRGYFVCEIDERPNVGGMVVLAKAASVDAAMRLFDLFRSRPALAST